jgi:DNA-binding beta-propeller fold protein YncE
LFRVDPVTQTLIATIRVGDNGYKEVRSFDDAIWVAYQANLRFSKIDPSTNRVTAEVDTSLTTRAPTPSSPSAMGRSGWFPWAGRPLSSGSIRTADRW